MTNQALNAQIDAGILRGAAKRLLYIGAGSRK
jgi:hypothetical protein